MGVAMNIALLCATQRGVAFLKKLIEIYPSANLFVFSFPEEPWEPPFLNEIRDVTLANHGTFHEVIHFNTAYWENFWKNNQMDLMLAVNWRYLFSPDVYRNPRLGTFIFHDSLLPEYRGFSPTVWAMINGEDHTGVTLFEVSDKMDEGLIVDQVRIPILVEDDIAAVTERVSQGYLKLLEDNLHKLLENKAPRISQDDSKATYVCKRLPRDNKINWNAPTREIYNLIRAVSIPYPGAYTYLDGQELRIWSARLIQGQPKNYIGRVPGRVVEVHKDVGSVVLTGDGALLIESVQSFYGGQTCAANLLNKLTQTLG